MIQVHELTSRQQRWRGTASGSGLASFGQIVEHISLLLPQSDDNGQDTFDKSAAVFTLGPEAASAPNHASAQGSLSRVVRWLRAVILFAVAGWALSLVVLS